ncbi:MAG: asparagine--tRNA ligase [Clostridia bacterium]|nr:asparagine--tRNA ligase [Clostridia bacterium]
MKRTEIYKIHEAPADYAGKEITVCGWARSIRAGKSISFIGLNDGSHFTPLQAVVEEEAVANYKELTSQNIGAAFEVKGVLTLTPDAPQPYEVKATEVKVIGTSTPDYPLQKKRHTREYLRTVAHLRPRTNLYGAAFRIRNAAAFGLHKFFQDNHFIYAHTPLISTSDAEGAGEMFKVTTLDLANPAKTENGAIDYEQDFFGKPTGLTVSGQLHGECMALAFGKIYTFGPTFRAERSYTGRHAAEFWMIEPEMAFADLEENMETAQAMLKFVLKYILDTCPADIEFLNKFVDKGLKERLEGVVNSEFGRITYTEAIELLKKNNDNFEYKVEWGSDLQTEHERYLTETVFQRPVFVTDYPKDIKAFYMRQNDDGKTVAAVDCLVPGIGEIIGGSQREERLEVLEARIQELGLNEEEYWWYTELRKFGGVVHSGYGLGFERLVMYATGIDNIRDVIPFPRTTGNAEF